jgi:hypothetical protein
LDLRGRTSLSYRNSEIERERGEEIGRAEGERERKV